MKNKTVVISLTTVFFLFLLLPSSWAGSKQQYRWEGVAIGVGAAILGNALVNHYYRSPTHRTYVYRYAKPPHRYHRWKSPPSHHYGYGKPYRYNRHLHGKPRHSPGRYCR